MAGQECPGYGFLGMAGQECPGYGFLGVGPGRNARATGLSGWFGRGLVVDDEFSSVQQGPEDSANAFDGVL